MICCCIKAESNVQRPCRIKSTTARTLGTRDVKGAATDASPGRTMGTAPEQREETQQAHIKLRGQKRKKFKL